MAAANHQAEARGKVFVYERAVWHIDNRCSQSINYGPWRDQVKGRTDSSYFSGANVNPTPLCDKDHCNISKGPIDEPALMTLYFIV